MIRPILLTVLTVGVLAVTSCTKDEADRSAAHLRPSLTAEELQAPDELRAALARWAAEEQQHLPQELGSGATLLEVDAYDLTVDMRIQLPETGGPFSSSSLIPGLLVLDAESCSDPQTRVLLDAGVKFAFVYVDKTGEWIRNHLLRQESCAT